MNETQDLGTGIKYFASKPFLMSLAIIGVTILVLYVIKQFLIKKVAYTTKDEQHKNTFNGVIFSILQYIVVIVAIVSILHQHGVNVTRILAGLGIMATIIGLALQDTLKDIIAGISIYNNNFYKVGDLIRYNGEECDVKYFSARVTKLQSVQTNSTYTVNNSLMTSVEKIKDSRVQHFLFGFDVDRHKIAECLEEICTALKKETSYAKDARYEGIQEISDRGVIYVIKYRCPAHRSELVRSKLMDITYDKFKEYDLLPKVSSAYR